MEKRQEIKQKTRARRAYEVVQPTSDCELHGFKVKAAGLKVIS